MYKIIPVIDEICKNCAVEIIGENLIKKAIAIAIKHSYSYFDSLMIAFALTSGCSILYTEDMHNQHVIENSLKIVSLFVKLSF